MPAVLRTRKTVTTLSDGRELIYFDEIGAPPRTPLPDRRNLPSVDLTTQMRRDLLTGEWVTVAQHRQTRTYLPPDDECPLDPSTETRLTEIPDPSYDVVVFENRFPSFAGLPGGEPVPSEAGGPMFSQAAGIGRCEVVCFTSDHDGAFSALSPARARTVIDAWVDRTRELSARPGIEQVFVFENRGREIGVTLSHPHGQIYGYPYVTPRTTTMLAEARAYRERTGGNLFADLLAAEIAAGERIVTRSAHWTAFVPFAARWPMEVHLYPNRQVPDLAALDDAELDDLSSVYLEILRRMEGAYPDSLPYIAGWYQAPVHADRDLAHLHLQVISIRRAPGKLKYLAGSESSMGAWINDLMPEDVAALLRSVSVPPA